MFFTGTIWDKVIGENYYSQRIVDFFEKSDIVNKKENKSKFNEIVAFKYFKSKAVNDFIH